jgi:soluble lytic murein transglycosylase-like protein
MSTPRRWARRAVLSMLAGGGLTAGLGGSVPGPALGAEAPAGAGSEGTTTTTQPPAATGPQAPASEQSGGAGGGSSSTTATTPSQPSTTPSSPAAPTGASITSTSTAPTPPAAPAGPSSDPAASSPAAGTTAPGPTVVVQRQQQVTQGVRTNASSTQGGGEPNSGAGGQGGTGAAQGGPATVPPGAPNGVAPAPQAAGGEVATLATCLTGSVVSAQALDFYRIPLFLLPIYKAAAFQYNVPWQVLAAINEVETNYGADQSISTAGAVGWMQFMPSTWLQYGVDATYAGYADPYNPADAVFAAARYLHAAGASHNLDAAIFAYNHSQAYVESVLLRARLIASFPRSVIGTLTGLVDGRAPTPGARALAPTPPAEGLALPGALGGAPPPGAASAAAGAATTATAATVPSTGSSPAPEGSSASSATAGATPLHGALPAPAHLPGSTPAPTPRTAARRAEADANAAAKASQLVELVGAPHAPVVAVQDGRIVHLGRSHALGRYLVLRDVYGDVFTYAGLGSIAPRYLPALPAPERTRQSSASSAGADGAPAASTPQGAGAEPVRDPAPALPASAGRQPPVTLRVRARPAPDAAQAGAPAVQGEAAGEAPPAGMGRTRLYAHPDNPIARAAAADATRGRAGSGRWVALRTGAVVSEGTVLGRLDTPPGSSVGRLRFAVRPAGDSGTIDPQPLLASWRKLGAALHPKGSRSAGTLVGATAAEALTMSKGELERAVLSDPGIQLDACGRRDVTAGAVDARVLAVLEFLSRSGLQPTAVLRCPHGASSPAGADAASVAYGAAARSALADLQAGGSPGVDITAINGVPVAGHQGRGTIADAAIRTLLTLRGRFAPHRIVSLMRYPDAPATQALASAWSHLRIDFLPPRPASAHAATAASGVGPAAASPLAVTGALNAAQWSELIARIAALPAPTVAAGPSAAAIRDPQAAPTNRALGARGLSAGG